MMGRSCSPSRHVRPTAPVESPDNTPQHRSVTVEEQVPDGVEVGASVWLWRTPDTSNL